MTDRAEEAAETGEAAVTPVPLPLSAGHVGDRPPTYEAEPTALPVADPDALDELVPDTVLEGARYGAGTLRAVSTRGDSARYRGEPRRDVLLTARFGTGPEALVLVALATGARGSEGAHLTAARTARSIARAVGRSHVRLSEDIRSGRRGDLKSGLHRLTGRSLGGPRTRSADPAARGDGDGDGGVPRAAGLRCLLLPADPACRVRVFFGVGDGGLFRLRDGVWQDIEPRVTDTAGEPVVGFGSPPSGTPGADRDRTLPDPDGGPADDAPHASQDLRASHDPRDPREPFRFRASVARPGDALLLCSAGLAEPLRGEEGLAAHLAGRWVDGPPGLAAFLADATVRVKGYADDRTAAAVWEA